MRRYALAVVFGALHVCQAFRTKTSRAWEGAVVKPVTFQSPETPLQAECSGTMGRSYLLGLLKRLPQHLIESFMIVCSTKKDGDLTDQLDDAVRRAPVQYTRVVSVLCLKRSCCAQALPLHVHPARHLAQDGHRRPDLPAAAQGRPRGPLLCRPSTATTRRSWTSSRASRSGTAGLSGARRSSTTR